MNYAENLKAIAALLGDSAYEQDPDFLAVLPAGIEAATLRIYRDLDLLSTRVTDTANCTANSRELILPTDGGVFQVLEVLRLVVDGVRGQPLLPSSIETLDMMWPSEVAPSIPSLPQYWAPVDQLTVRIAPPPDDGYTMLCFGTKLPDGLTPQNADGTFITNNMPDLFLAAEMCWFVGGWQHNWAPAANDPGTAAGWGGEYERLKAQALELQLRARLQSNGWGSRKPSPIVTPKQT